MTLIEEKHVRGANKEFTFKHRVKGVNRTFTAGATTFENARKKVWKDVSRAYKELKKASV